LLFVQIRNSSSCGSQQNSFPNSCYKMNLRESLTVGFFYISCDVIKIINVDKNNERVFLEIFGKHCKRLLHL